MRLLYGGSVKPDNAQRTAGDRQCQWRAGRRGQPQGCRLSSASLPRAALDPGSPKQGLVAAQISVPCQYRLLEAHDPSRHRAWRSSLWWRAAGWPPPPRSNRTRAPNSRPNSCSSNWPARAAAWRRGPEWAKANLGSRQAAADQAADGGRRADPVSLSGQAAGRIARGGRRGGRGGAADQQGGTPPPSRQRSARGPRPRRSSSPARANRQGRRSPSTASAKAAGAAAKPPAGPRPIRPARPKPPSRRQPRPSPSQSPSRPQAKTESR